MSRAAASSFSLSANSSNSAASDIPLEARSISSTAARAAPAPGLALARAPGFATRQGLQLATHLFEALFLLIVFKETPKGRDTLPEIL